MTFTDCLLQVNLLEVPLFDLASLTALGIKFGINIAIVYLIVMLIYRPTNNKTEYIFTYFIFNILIFFLCHLMLNSDVGVGFGFGLFALFSIMRYRTMTIDIKDMTYLFAVVCIAVMNALNDGHASYIELIFVNIAIVLFIFLMEKMLFGDKLVAQSMTYEKIDLVKPQHYAELKADLEERLGRTIKRVEIISLNYLNDSAVITVYYTPIPDEQLIARKNLD